MKLSIQDITQIGIFAALTAIGVVGTIIIYAFGLPYMYYILNIFLSKNLHILQIMQIGMLTFIPGDTLKAIIAVFIANKLKGKLQNY